MNNPDLGVLTVVGVLLVGPNSATHAPQSMFVGTTPCAGVVRDFAGGIPASAACHALRWELTLGVPDAPGRWLLKAVYAVPAPGNPNAAVDGPQVTKQGSLHRSTRPQLGRPSTLFRLVSDSGTSVAFAEIGADLVNLANEDGTLVPGTSAWSYTLTRADRVEPPVVELPRAGEGSYTIPSKQTGSHVFGIFGGRTPCAGLMRDLKLTNIEGCVRLKWRLTLLKDPATGNPTRYLIDNSLTREHSWTGAWRILRGVPDFPDATVYQLDADTSHGPILLLRADDNLLLFLNQQRQLLPGNADLSYTLTRSIQ